MNDLDGLEKIVPYFVHEGVVARQERTINRLWVLCIIIFIAFVGSNAAWLYYESQWEVTQTTQEVSQSVDSGDGSVNITGIGDIYGEGETDVEGDH